MTEHKVEDLARGFIKRYSHYVTSSRVLPGLDLKPVQRRLLWSLIESGARHNKGPFKKSAAIVGTCMGSYHPHGDLSIYGALCALANSPNALVSGRGNFGGSYGDPAAASRYTEVKTSPLFEELYDPYTETLGEMTPNYDESKFEPTVLQTKLPLSLLIGSHGIGVGLISSLPAHSVESVIAEVRSCINLSNTDNGISYAYGCTEYQNKIYPLFKAVKRDGKEYLHISDLPVGSSIGILTSSNLIQELVASRVVEIFDESDPEKINIFISAPLDIQKMIIESCTKSLREDFKFYWKKLRRSGYIDEWLLNRLQFIKRREYYIAMQEWRRGLELCIMSSLADTTNPGEKIESVVSEMYEKSVPIINEEAKEFLDSKEDFIKRISNKPISRLVKSKEQTSFIPAVLKISDQDTKEILLKEISSIDKSLFTPASAKASSLKYSTNTQPVTRFVAIRDDGIEVRYTKIPRVTNWESEKDILVYYSDGSSEKLDKYYFGVKQTTDKKIVGFSYPGEVTVMLTESKKLYSFVRTSAVTEPISLAFPALDKSMIINGKEYKSLKNLFVTDVTSFKIIEN